MEFPSRIYTLDEFKRARECVEKGYKHRLKIVGSLIFRSRVKVIMELIRKARYYDYLRTYIRQIEEINGLSQLREADAMLWLNLDIVKDPIEGARFIIQKTEQMKDYLAGNQYYEKGELAAVRKSVEFLQVLKNKRIDEELRKKCEEAVKMWTAETIL